MTRYFGLAVKNATVCIVMLLVASVLCVAQTTGIAGTVTDTAGAVVQGAEVTARNLASNTTRSVLSSDSGAYSVTNLAPGAYEIVAKKAAFKTFRVPSLTLTVDQTATVNIRMEVGTVTEEVQVRADQLPPVDLESAQVSNLVTSKQLEAMPLITRNPYELVFLSPGTAQTNAYGGPSVNGSRERNNNFMLDGVDNNDTGVPGGLVTALGATPDSTQEFRVITNNFNAEYGRNTGAIIDVVTKSGTNSLHGGVYEFGRWNGFGGARDWFNRTQDGAQDPYVRNQFGFSIGGPIRKDKTFFFGNAEWHRFRTTLTNQAIVPTTAFKTGVFNYFGDPVDITLNGDNNGTGDTWYGDPAFNAPPDPTMQKVFALYPDPTVNSGDGLTGATFFPSSSAENSYTTVAKIDHHFTDREILAVRFGYDGFRDPNPFHDDALPGNVGGVSSNDLSRGLAANLTSTLSNNLINSFVFGWNSIYSNFGCTGTNVLDSVLNSTDRYGNGWDFVMSPFTSFGCLSLVSDGQWRKTGTTSYGDSLSWAHGNHTFKFGGDFRNIAQQGPNSFYSRRYVALNGVASGYGIPMVEGVPSDDLSLEAAAQAFWGFVDTDFQAQFFNKDAARQATDNKHFRQHEYDWYGQDTWKVRPNLTLTLGLRYQLDGVPYEENGNLSNLFGSPMAGPVTMTIVGPGTGHQLYASDYSNLEPRIGFAWDPWGDGKTSVRAAFGIFHDRVFGNLFGNARGNPPFEQDYSRSPFDTVNGFYGDAIFQGFALPVPPEQVPTAVIPDFDPNAGVGGLAPVLFDPHYRNSASNNWNFGIQRELPGNNTLDLAYVGSEGHHIFRVLDPNSPDPARVQQLLDFCVPSNPDNFGFAEGQCSADYVRSIYLYEGAEYGYLPFNAVAHNALYQPYYNTSVGNAIYNSLQVKFTHRLSHGVQVQASYTWAHALDNSNDAYAAAEGNRAFPRNSRKLSEEWGNSDNDIRHVAVINYVWEMPFGKGKSHLNSGFAGKFFEGWQLSGLTTLQSGHPFDVFTSTDMERTGVGGRADLVGDPYAPGSNTPANSQGDKIWFTNPAAFSDRTDGSFAPLYAGPGTSGRNHFYGPAFVNFDAVWSKTTSITERANLELRVECYNIFNHPHFANPGFDLASNRTTASNFGLITTTEGRPDGTTSARQMQVALKVNF
jgi:outer membrane receptor protein involved in Fe transport